MSGEGTSRMLDVKVRNEGTVTVITVSGEIDIASVPHLQSALEESRQDGSPLVVDMTNVGFMGSAGLSALMVASEAAKPQRLRVVASDAVRRPIEVTGLDKLLAMFPTLDDALAADGLGATN
ncbi:STAS domain-containing protein [Nocardia sp. CDC159]|uniref:Anti-sigma factor antagonist n=1 Tax=Nocardia pulmonis TaxID=2951408 RepID=A0A9X2E5H0_9NOCA|nr:MULTISPECIES: STAS domain-containing protein [Nocardia]MCM6774169.1 STAS domain-containing protein [Nocardia pulmonis]MCM6787056.1 STAS domain-containing protein [Nocardia sp. CDC159]